MTLLEANGRKCEFLRRLGAAERDAWCRDAPRSRRPTASASRSRRRSRRRRSPPSGASRSSLRAARRSSGSARAPTGITSHGRPSSSAASSSRAPRRAPRAAEARPDAAGLSAAPRGREEASARLSSLDPVPGDRLCAREPEGRRRQDDDRDQPRRLSRRGGRARRSSSTSTRRRTRPRGSASAPTGTSTYDLLDGAPLAGARAAHALRRTSTSCPRSPTSPAPPSSSRAARTASATSPAPLQGARDDYRFVFLDCPPSLGPLTVNALAAADRVLVPVQAEYYALEGLTQLDAVDPA